MSRIIICGLNGCGKSTLGDALSKELNYPHKDIESYYFNDNKTDYKYAQSRSKSEVTKAIEKDFKNNHNIIFTSCKGDYGSISNLCDLVILIRLDKDTRVHRVKQRSYNQFGDRILKDGDLYEREMIFFDKVYKKDESEIREWFNNLNCCRIEIDGKNTVEENVDVVLEHIQKISK